MNPSIYSIWLMLCEEQRAIFTALIQELANRYSMPVFAPHVTLCSGKWMLDDQDLLKNADRFVGQTALLELKVQEIDWTDHWATFFFLRLAGEEDFFERAGSGIQGSHLSPVGPHLSLLYGVDAPQIDRPALRQELSGRLPTTLRFDGMALVRPATGRWEDVGSWELLNSVQLSG